MRPATKTIDLRSDTVTRPTLTMRPGISEAAVGDDQYSEDATFTRLETRFTELIGKEAALLSECNRGDEALLGDESDIFCFESGGPSALGGIPFNLSPTGRFGDPQLADFARSLRPTGPRYPRTERVCLKDTDVPVILRLSEPTDHLPSLPKANLPGVILDRLVPLIASAVPDHARA